MNLFEIVGLGLGNGFVIVGCVQGWSLGALLTVSASGALLPGVLSMLCCMRDAWLRPDPRQLSRKHLGDLAGFVPDRIYHHHGQRAAGPKRPNGHRRFDWCARARDLPP